MEVNRIVPAEGSASAKTRCEIDPPQHILLVDDDSSIRRLAVEVLTRAGYNVDGAVDGAAAWQALNAGRYDLLITDNRMPNMTGIELVKKLRAARMELPVIMATGALPMKEFTRQTWLQPAVALIKPFSAAELLGAVKMVLSVPGNTADGARLPADGEMKHEKISRAGTSARVQQPCPTSYSHRILAVDEDRDLRLLYIEALSRPGGYHVDVAEDGAAGWAALHAHHYHLLITEHEMPRLSGLNLVRRLRAAHMALPVVLAARRLPTDKLARYPSLKLAATLEKPFAVDTLLDTVNAVLRTTDGACAQIDPRPGRHTGPSANALRL